MIPLWDVRPDQQQYLPQQLLCNPMFRYILGWLKNLNWKFTLDLGNLRLTDIITVSLYLFDLLYTYGNQSQTQSAAYRLFKVIIHHRFSFIFLLQVLSDNILQERNSNRRLVSSFYWILHGHDVCHSPTVHYFNLTMMSLEKNVRLRSFFACTVKDCLIFSEELLSHTPRLKEFNQYSRTSVEDTLCSPSQFVCNQ